MLRVSIIVNIIVLIAYLIYNASTVTKNGIVISMLLVMAFISSSVNIMVTIVNVFYAAEIYMLAYNNKISIAAVIGLAAFFSIVYLAIYYLITREVNYQYILTLLLIIPSTIIIILESKYVIYEEKGVLDDSENSKG